MYLNFIKRKLNFELNRKINIIQSIPTIKESANTILITVNHELSLTQVYPFYFYKEKIRKLYQIEFVELPLDTLTQHIDQNLSPPQNYTIKRICFQHGFMMKDDDVVKHLDYLSQYFPNAKIAFFDWFGPLSIAYANCANAYIDIYVKKQIYRDFSLFSLPTRGDTNLNDCYARRYDLPDPVMEHIIPEGFQAKLRLGSNFFLSPQLVDLFTGRMPEIQGRDIDLHARLATQGIPWYQAMRMEAKTAVDKLNGINIAAEGRIKRYKFYRELQRSKIVFSPFGYGEVCWRDYEAFATGALLIKPDMSHLIVSPDVFVKDETYVAINWDLTDLEDKVYFYLKNHEQRQAITHHAFSLIQDYIKSDEIPNNIAAMF